MLELLLVLWMTHLADYDKGLVADIKAGDKSPGAMLSDIQPGLHRDKLVAISQKDQAFMGQLPQARAVCVSEVCKMQAALVFMGRSLVPPG